MFVHNQYTKLVVIAVVFRATAVLGLCFNDSQCDDGLACTIDTCVNLTCVNTPSNALCDDGVFCNGVETCDTSYGCVFTGNPCATGEFCDEILDACTVGIPPGSFCDIPGLPSDTVVNVFNPPPGAPRNCADANGDSNASECTSDGDCTGPSTCEGYTWHDPGNWSLGHTPRNDEIACIRRGWIASTSSFTYMGAVPNDSSGLCRIPSIQSYMCAPEALYIEQGAIIEKSHHSLIRLCTREDRPGCFGSRIDGRLRLGGDFMFNDGNDTNFFFVGDLVFAQNHHIAGTGMIQLISEKVCDGGTAEGVACNNHNDCPGGVCVGLGFTQGLPAISGSPGVSITLDSTLTVRAPTSIHEGLTSIRVGIENGTWVVPETGSLFVSTRFNGTLCASNLDASDPTSMPGNIDILSFGPNATVCDDPNGNPPCANCGQPCSLSPGPPLPAGDTCWNGATDTGVVCSWNGDCASSELCGNRNRYIAFDPANSLTNCAIAVRILATAPKPNAGFGDPLLPLVNSVFWVGPTHAVCENTSDCTQGSFAAAGLRCMPLYRDWSSDGILHVYGAELVPNSYYDVRFICNPGQCGSEPLSLSTNQVWGDVVAPFGVFAASGQPDFQDVSAVVDKFGNVLGAPSVSRSDLAPAVPDNLVNFGDISAVVDAFGQTAYPYSASAECP